MKASLCIDDLVSGSSTVKEAFAMFIKAKSRLQDAGFHMHKWKTNHPELREAIKREVDVQENSDPERETTYAKESLGHKESESKVLGVKWDIDKDVLKFEFKEIVDKAEQLEPTKRNILSVIASVFDPLGLISPVIVTAKTFLQDICKSKISLDERPSEEILRKWLDWVQNLKQVEEIIFRRCVYPSLTEEVDEVTFHGFGDTNGKAYCAAVYMVCNHGATTSAQLLTSKTRVAPLKQQTIPRLELMAAKILASLVDTVKKALGQQVDITSTTLWLDSATALLWIKKVGEWKPFVQHRVKEILKLTDRACWQHCPTDSNPADIWSLGTKETKLKDDKL
eukprot:Seg633.2 transcript_id=Seg633.2/GoldUCD/mRNA.D3Y31 product="hypothetical protein" protein_id=Seg633.2/GoldUCD/D3Y31